VKIPLKLPVKLPVQIISYESLVKYQLFILMGFIMAVGSALNALEIIKISSDWFWCLAGLAIVIEGLTSLIKQKKFDKKYKIVEKEEVK